MLLEKYPEKKMLLEKRIKQHEKDIVDYVTSDSFHAQLNLQKIQQKAHGFNRGSVKVDECIKMIADYMADQVKWR